MTLVWKLTKEEQLKICHLHFSTAHHYSRLFESPLEVEHRSYTRNEHHSDEDDLITIKDDQHRIRIISLSAIEYACADGHNTIIYTHEETIHARMRWKEFLSHLDTHFLQVHRSYVVKKESVKLVGKNYLETYSGNKIPVPVKNMHEIVNALTKLKS
jgi:DNA-binding LytR/AlgR family response regulator